MYLLSSINTLVWSLVGRMYYSRFFSLVLNPPWMKIKMLQIYLGIIFFRPVATDSIASLLWPPSSAPCRAYPPPNTPQSCTLPRGSTYYIPSYSSSKNNSLGARGMERSKFPRGTLNFFLITAAGQNCAPVQLNTHPNQKLRHSKSAHTLNQG